MGLYTYSLKGGRYYSVENMCMDEYVQKNERACLAENRLPLGVVAVVDEPFDLVAINRMVWAFLFLGLAARTIRFALMFPIWQDEAYLAMNYFDRGYLGLTDTLECHQVCPLFFLWAEYTLVKLLGFSPAALRVFPFLCGAASLFLFKHLASRLLRGTALLFAVAIFATAYPLIRYSCEAKPYGCDIFFSLAMLTSAMEWWIGRRTRWLWLLAAITPAALGCSYPAVFAAGGISLAIALALLLERGRKGWTAWTVYNIVLVGGFGLLYALSMRNQSTGELEWMRDCWEAVFPPLDSAIGFVKWLAEVHTSELLQYPVGGASGASILTTVCCGAALYTLWRRRQAVLAAFCLAPLLPNFVAACMQRYPYGGHVRFALYLAPAVCLLTGLGAAVFLVRPAKNGRPHGRTAAIALAALLAIIASSSIVRDFIFPYRTESVLHHRDFARWFWNACDDGVPTLFWERDIEAGRRFSPVPHASVAALYLCNRATYWRPDAKVTLSAADCDSSVVPSDQKQPFRCVRFTSLNAQTKSYICGSAADDSAFAAWLKNVETDYILTDEQKYELAIITRRKSRGARPMCIDTITVYRFAPKAAQPSSP